MKVVEIEDGLNEFNLRGLKDCTFFEFKNRSKFLAWEMNWNTLMNYFVGKVPKHQILFMKYYEQLTNALEYGNVNEGNVIELITPLLKSFSNGKYSIEFKSDYADAYLIKTGITTVNSAVHGKIIEKSAWVGANQCLFAIQDSTDEKRVNYYIDLIKQKYKPQVILMKLANSEINFIIDGHHKLEACQKGYEAMHAIQITKLDNYETTEEEVLKCFEKTGESEDYRNVLKTHIAEINTTTNTE